ncbi:aldo/keto reductase [Sodalis glossinidius]|uniref:aldo/keto reductase n=1 Tax=Sodalis glossinidius TaxID=63612 RepID=UPI0018E0B350|nr:aldo/keto reductase [Sodalis glossinidius]
MRYIGITNVDADTLRRAHSTCPLTALQFEYSLMSPDIEQEMLPLCRELGIGVTAYGVLGRGLLTGGSGAGYMRSAYYPRFQGDNLTRNARLVDALAAVAAKEGISAAQAAIGWVASQGRDIIPLVGSRTAKHLAEALASPLTLSAESLAVIEVVVPYDTIQGDRFMATDK